MTDILTNIVDILAEIDDGERPTLDRMEMYVVLTRAAGEIKRLRKANSDMGWRLNPDRMGGQFTQEEINRGDEWR
jgi:hypothetical protein